MRTLQFLTATAAAALLLGASPAFAQSTELLFDDVSQTTWNNAAVVNYGDINRTDTGIGGHGASLSISATGAVSSLSVTSIGGLEFDTVEVATDYRSSGANLYQSTTNHGVVTNIHHVGDWVVNAGSLGGNGASASVSATGGVSAISLSTISTPNTPDTSDVSFGSIWQGTSNYAPVTNYGGSITAGAITGSGASLSIGATGAVSSVSVSSIGDTDTLNTIHTKSITQGTTNYGAASINNSGSIAAGSISADGVGASASVSASGAASSVSVSNIGGSGQFEHVHFRGNIAQTTTNHASVTNTGTVGVGALGGNGASASVSAVGAASAVSYSNIKK